MNLEEALYRAITGGRSPRSGGTVTGMVTELRRTYPVQPPPGISGRTWRRLRANPGQGVAKPTADALRAAQRAARVTPARTRLLRGTPIIGVHATVRVSDDERDRKILLSSWLNTGAPISAGDATGLMRQVLDDFLAGREEEAAERFRSALESGLTGSSGGRRLQLVDVTAIRFWAPGRAGGSAAQMWQRT